MSKPFWNAVTEFVQTMFYTRNQNRKLFETACLKGNVEMVHLFLTIGTIDLSGQKILQTLCRVGHLGLGYRRHVEIVDRLLQDGCVDPSANNNFAIQQASKNGLVEIVDRLLQDGCVDPSADDNFAIRYASLNGHIDVVNRLLQEDRSKNRVDPSAMGQWALSFACSYGRTNIVDRLLQDNRVDPSANGNQILTWACQHGNIDVVNLLLQEGRVDPSANNNDALRYALANNHTIVVNRLLQDEHVKHYAELYKQYYKVQHAQLMNFALKIV